MSTAGSRTIPANKVGLIGGLLLLGWLAFALWPDRLAPKLAAAPIPVESKLQAVGLADNVDWEGMPELFAVWSEHAGWKDDKAQFAYWDRNDRSYSYFFEATRVNGKVRFRAMSEPDFIKDSGSSYALIYAGEPGICMVADQDLKTESPEHPFIFFKPVPVQWSVRRSAIPDAPGNTGTTKPVIKIDIGSPSVDLPKPSGKTGVSGGR